MPRDIAEIQRQLRVSFEPEADDPRGTVRTCSDCGDPFRDWKSKWRSYCASCGADRMRARWDEVRANPNLRPPDTLAEI